MRVSYNKCDHCHAELVNRNDYIEYGFNLFGEYYEIDLCEECVVRFKNTVNDFLFPDSQEWE